ncbi:MAG: hypothetical protein ABI091_27720 [Ferruginibacter sp.]
MKIFSKLFWRSSAYNNNHLFVLLQAPLCFGPASHGFPFASRRLSAVVLLSAMAEGFKVGGRFIYIILFALLARP